MRHGWTWTAILLTGILLGWWTRFWESPPVPAASAGAGVATVKNVPPPAAAPARRQLFPGGSTASGEEAGHLLDRLRQRVAGDGALPRQAVVTFRSPEAMADFLRRAAGHGLRELGRIGALNALRIGYDSLAGLRDALQETAGGWSNIGANYPVGIPNPLVREDRSAGVGTTPYDGTSFLAAIGAGGDRSGWGEGVMVAVVDSGVEAHPTFGEGQVTHLDLVNDGQPFNGHGTAMAGLIAGQDPQAPGVAPASTLLDVRVAGADGTGDTFTLAAGIVQAAEAGADIINVSLGSYGDSPAVRDAVAYAESMGVVVVGAAGNDQAADQLMFPAAIGIVVSVGGVDADLQQAYFSNSGNGLTVTAPAVGIQSAYGKDWLAVGDGTSQAAAITSGVLAGAIASGATTAAEAAAWVRKNAKPLELSPERGGAGLIQVPPR